MRKLATRCVRVLSRPCSILIMVNDVLPASSTNHDKIKPISSQPSPFWFDDGSIIISIAKERFKLHKSLLSRHSTLLESLSISQSADSDAKDVPTVEIPESLTNLKDFTALLKHLYHDVCVLLFVCVFAPSHPHLPQRMPHFLTTHTQGQ